MSVPERQCKRGDGPESEHGLNKNHFFERNDRREQERIVKYCTDCGYPENAHPFRHPFKAIEGGRITTKPLVIKPNLDLEFRNGICEIFGLSPHKTNAELIEMIGDYVKELQSK